MAIGRKRAFFPEYIGVIKDQPSPRRRFSILTILRRVRIGWLGKAVSGSAAELSAPTFVRDLEIITPNFSRRLSGVTSTLERILPVLARSARIAALGPGLAPSTPRISVFDLPVLWQKPTEGEYRIWHARRNIEMLAGVVLRDILGFPLKLVFTSASQRHHTRWTRFLIARMDGLIATSNRSTTTKNSAAITRGASGSPASVAIVHENRRAQVFGARRS